LRVQYEDVVYLKNGSVIRGIIIEQIPNESIKIKTADRNIFVFTLDEIEKIAKEELPEQLRSTASNEFKKSGYEFFTGINVAFAKDIDVYGFSIVNGYRINPYVYLGLGAEYNIWPNGSTLPIYIDARFNFLKTKYTPYFQLDFGYSVGWVNGYTLIRDQQPYEPKPDNSMSNGFMFNPTFGFRSYINNRFAINFSVGYRYQKAQYTHTYFSPSYGIIEIESYDEYNLGIVKFEFSF